MKTPHPLYNEKLKVYTCELSACALCGAKLIEWGYQSSPKTIFGMTAVCNVAQRPKHCPNDACAWHTTLLKSAAWQHLAPRYGVYGYDVIAQIGWVRQEQRQPFVEIHANLPGHVPISEAEVRYLYHQQYLPLLACVERQQLARLNAVAAQTGLLLTLDGLAPEGGEPQLWVVRELQTGLTVRSGWLSQQDQATFSSFLQPIADQNWRVRAILSDKQRGLEPAVAAVFPGIPHAWCQLHYLNNAAESVAAAVEQLKVTLRQDIRDRVGLLIRQEAGPAAPGVLTVTGLLPSPLASASATGVTGTASTPVATATTPTPTPVATATTPASTPVATATAPASTPVATATTPTPTPVATATTPTPTPVATATTSAQARESIVRDLLRRVRYLLTLKARPPFGLAGLEMYERLTEVVTCLNRLLGHQPEARLAQLRSGLQQALATAQADYTLLRQAGDWLQQLAALLDPDGAPPRTGVEVRNEFEAYLAQIEKDSAPTPRLREFSAAIAKVSRSYAPGLFYTYDVAGLPRTNNDRESEFRNLNRRLLRTTGQKGLTRRILQRAGAWELLPHPSTLADTAAAFARIATPDLRQEQQRVREHRGRFRLHTRSAKQAQAQLAQLVQLWTTLPTADSS
ncbi:MAG: hypothetical protein WAV53_13295 [Anaerolineae bacterium]